VVRPSPGVGWPGAPFLAFFARSGAFHRRDKDLPLAGHSRRLRDLRFANTAVTRVPHFSRSLREVGLFTDNIHRRTWERKNDINPTSTLDCTIHRLVYYETFKMRTTP